MEEVLRRERIESTLTEKVEYELSPSDLVPGMLPTWISWPLFYKPYLDWKPLRAACGRLAEMYPILCGRLLPAENGRHKVVVDPAHNGFGLLEMRAESRNHMMRRYSSLAGGPAPYTTPSMNWPYFCKPPYSDLVLRDSDSLFGIHVIYLFGGCVVNTSIRHVLCDGERLVQLLIDFSRLYRSMEISPKHFNRSFLWPDCYLSQRPGYDPSKYPRQITTVLPEEPEKTYSEILLRYHETTLFISTFYINQATIDTLKADINKWLKGVDFVSTNDLACALHWMFKAECRSKTQPVTASTLEIAGTSLFLSVDLEKTCLGIVPPNFFGNATAASIVVCDTVEDCQSIIEILAKLASMIRQRVNDIQTKEEAALEGLLYFYESSNAGDAEEGPEMISITPSYAKLPVEEIDFGKGSPLHCYTTPPFPVHSPFCAISKGPKDDGILLYMVANHSERRRLRESVVIAECAPGIKMYPNIMKDVDGAEVLGMELK